MINDQVKKSEWEMINYIHLKRSKEEKKKKKKEERGEDAQTWKDDDDDGDEKEEEKMDEKDTYGEDKYKANFSKSCWSLNFCDLSTILIHGLSFIIIFIYLLSVIISLVYIVKLMHDDHLLVIIMDIASLYIIMNNLHIPIILIIFLFFFLSNTMNNHIYLIHGQVYKVFFLHHQNKHN